MQSRAAALGWGAVSQVAVVVGSHPAGAAPPASSTRSVAAPARGGRARSSRSRAAARLHPRRRRRTRWPAAHGARPALRRRAARGRADGAPPLRRRPRRRGPRCPGCSAAPAPGRTAPARCWPTTCSPSGSWLGDVPARRLLVDADLRPLVASAGGPLLETAAAFLDGGGGLEATARMLFVHPNTVRYRLGRHRQDRPATTSPTPHDAQHRADRPGPRPARPPDARGCRRAAP